MSGEKRKESEVAAVTTLPRGGEKRKWLKKTIADAASMEEIEMAMGGFSVAELSSWPEPVTLVLDCRLREIMVAIDRNARELTKLGQQVEGIAWETKRAADVKDPKGKGKAMPKESEEQEESDKTDGGMRSRGTRIKEASSSK